jgi:hypothetical protein
MQIIPLLEPTNNPSHCVKQAAKPTQCDGPSVWAKKHHDQTDITANQTQRSDKRYLEKSAV